MADCDVIKAGIDLRALKDKGLLKKKGRAKATYYIAGEALNLIAGAVNTQGSALNTQGSALNTQGSVLNDEAGAVSVDKLLDELEPDILIQIKNLKQREKDKSKTKQIIKDICTSRHYTLGELSLILKRSVKYISREFVKPMTDSGEMQYKYPEMINHPEQAYNTVKKK